MKNTSLAKTLTASLPTDAQATFTRISDPDQLPTWHSSFCRALKKESGSLIVESPRGDVAIHFVRDDHSRVLDIIIRISDGVTLTHAIRIIPNGEGSEIIWTLVKPRGLPDAIFHEQLRWAGSALHHLRKTPVAKVPDLVATTITVAGATEGTEQPLQAPSAAEVSSMPLSGKKLFVGNLSYDWTDDQLRAHFAEQGTIALAEVARFRGRGGRSRGFGFIEMTTEAEAQIAIEKLHGSMAGGRQIIVRLAKSQESRPPQNDSRAPKVEGKIFVEAPAVVSDPPVSDQDRPEPGNERHPRAPRAPLNRTSRTERPRRGGVSRPRPTGESRPYQEQDISNKSGYEIFPRRSATNASDPARTSLPSSAPPSRSTGEASPYMDDTGDIENHGRRPPPRHRRRS